MPQNKCQNFVFLRKIFPVELSLHFCFCQGWKIPAFKKFLSWTAFENFPACILCENFCLPKPHVGNLLYSLLGEKFTRCKILWHFQHLVLFCYIPFPKIFFTLEFRQQAIVVKLYFRESIINGIEKSHFGTIFNVVNFSPQQIVQECANIQEEKFQHLTAAKVQQEFCCKDIFLEKVKFRNF